ncbi:hypothetical protein ACJQWK_00985 [Exserohilum turcicum]
MKLALVLATIAAVSSAAAVIPSELLVDKRQCLLNGFSCDGRIKGGNCCSGNCIAVVCSNANTFACQPSDQTNCVH